MNIFHKKFATLVNTHTYMYMMIAYYIYLEFVIWWELPWCKESRRIWGAWRSKEGGILCCQVHHSIVRKGWAEKEINRRKWKQKDDDDGDELEEMEAAPFSCGVTEKSPTSFDCYYHSHSLRCCCCYYHSWTSSFFFFTMWLSILCLFFCFRSYSLKVWTSL